MSWMAPKYHPTPLSGGDRKALTKELGKARAMTNILAAQSAEMRAKGEAMIQQADRLFCESWNERMWSDGEPIGPSPTIDQAVNGFPWLGIVRPVQGAERRRPRGDEAPADHVRARPRQPPAVPQMRQGGLVLNQLYPRIVADGVGIFTKGPQAMGMVTKKNAPAAFTTGASVSVVAGRRNHRCRHSLMVAI
jgi:hypothetical protein